MRVCQSDVYDVTHWCSDIPWLPHRLTGRQNRYYEVTCHFIVARPSLNTPRVREVGHLPSVLGVTMPGKLLHKVAQSGKCSPISFNYQ